MDPIGGSWYASYNRLTATPTTFQTATSANADQVLHLAPATVNIQTVPTTTATQLLIQATGPTTVALANQATSFNTGGFLSTPTAVGYDVFTPFFPKQTTHYFTTQHAQPIRAQIVTTSQPHSPEESAISGLRSNFTSSEQNSFFDQTTTASSGNWSLSNATNTQSPFGILPHESITVSTPIAATSKANAYDDPFGTHFSNGTADPKSRAQSPISNNVSSIKCIVTESSIGGAHNYFQNASAFDSDGLGDSYSPDDGTSDASSGLHHHQSCIVSTPSLANSNRIAQLPERSPVPTTIYLNATDKNVQGSDTGHDSSQSSPISFSLMDSRNLSYNPNNGSGKIQTPNGTVQFQIVNQPQQSSQPSSCRLYSATADTEYHHPVRSKSAASTDSAYSSNTSQNGPDCAVVVPRRPSPMQTHSQASPLGHVPSPATYPMYNSPMASMSSPSPLQHADASSPYKNLQQQQMTPPSPMDVTVTRSPSQQNQVVYSSVITRALGANENKTAYATDATSRSTFERSPDFSQSKQMCWENDGGKYATSNYLTSDGTDANVLGAQQIQNLPAEPSSCMEASRLNLQNLSSCRGDPMNLQSDHADGQNAEHEQAKRKELDRVDELVTTVANEFANRIPPPAHHNAIVNQQQQQQQQQSQQNGYLEFDRWNLTNMPTAKLITTTPATFVTQQQQQQNNQVQTANFISGNTVAVQQPMLVTHAAPAVSYIPTFQITSSTPLQQQQIIQPELQSTVDMSVLNGSCPASGCLHSSVLDDAMPDDRPQVIVPNIEEELDFLQQPQVPGLPPRVIPQPPPKPEVKVRPTSSDPNSGFMTSYLKFLQGEKDGSPPPQKGKKPAWQKKIYESNNSSDAWPKTTTPITSQSIEIPTIDYENDPRYFPLPKERKRALDSSDDGFSSDDERSFSSKKKELAPVCQVQTQTPPPIKLHIHRTPEGKPKKGRPIKPGGPTDRKRKAAAAAAMAAAAAAAKGLPPPVVPKRKKGQQLPRRESSRRKAKEKTLEEIAKKQDTQQPADPYEQDEEGDSDNDPAWTPAAKSTGDEQELRKKRGRNPVIGGKRRKLSDDYTGVGQVFPQKRGRKKKNFLDVNARANAIKLSCKIDEKLLASVSDEDIDISPFKSGEFVVLKSDLHQEYPPLWRIDGKTLLQKYEPFQSSGKTLYKNISTYSGWAPQNRHIYQQVPVKFWQQGKMETVVEFLRDELIMDDSEFIIKFMKDTEKYQDNFEVYIQTLISQALDSNFLTEIFQEQDDYFLLNVKTVDEITEERKQQLLSTTTWRTNVITALSTWPCINVLRDNVSDYKGKSCDGCTRTKIHSRVLLYGQPYNSTTLEGSPPGPEVPQEKDFIFCRMCQKKVALFNKVAHQKYLMFLECARRVADKRLADPNKDTTIILNELLADESWLNLLFREVRNIWAEIEILQQQARKKAENSTAKMTEASSESQNNQPNSNSS